MTIDYAQLRQLDLNLLVIFDALIDKASVTQAAQTLSMSQSAVSHALKRLRDILGDDILIRTSKRQMEVTPYARQLSIRVRQTLTDIQDTLLIPETFEPATAREDFRIAASDYVEATLGGALLAQVSQTAHIRIRIVPFDKETVLEQLDDNRIDIAFGPGLPLKRWHLQQALYTEELVCVVRSDCPIESLSMAEYGARSHILASLRNDFHGIVDERLDQARRVAWSTPHFMAIPFFLETGVWQILA